MRCFFGWHDFDWKETVGTSCTHRLVFCKRCGKDVEVSGNFHIFDRWILQPPQLQKRRCIKCNFTEAEYIKFHHY